MTDPEPLSASLRGDERMRQERAVSAARRVERTALTRSDILAAASGHGPHAWAGYPIQMEPPRDWTPSITGWDPVEATRRMIERDYGDAYRDMPDHLKSEVVSLLRARVAAIQDERDRPRAKRAAAKAPRSWENE